MSTVTDRKIQVLIGTGTPPAGDLVKGGIALEMDGTNLVGIWTSSNGTDITKLTTISTDTAKLEGLTLSEVQTQIVNAITGGAGEAYDTLIELQNELEGNDTELSTILATQATKVDKVDGYSLVDDALITKLTNLPADAQKNVQSDWNATTGDALILNKPIIPDGVSTRADVRVTTDITGTDVVTEAGIRTAINDSISYISEY